MEGAAKTLDKTIAMSIRGHNGALTVAQISILKDLSLAKASLDNLIKLAKAGQAMA